MLGELVMRLQKMKRAIEDKIALSAAVRRRQVELEGWKRMLHACYQWADEISHEPSRQALLAIAENYRKVLENAQRHGTSEK